MTSEPPSSSRRWNESVLPQGDRSRPKVGIDLCPRASTRPPSSFGPWLHFLRAMERSFRPGGREPEPKFLTTFFRHSYRRHPAHPPSSFWDGTISLRHGGEAPERKIFLLISRSLAPPPSSFHRVPVPHSRGKSVSAQRWRILCPFRPATPPVPIPPPANPFWPMGPQFR